MSRRLVPLRIPSGWAVVFNIFVAFDDDEPITSHDADAYLSDDILSIERMAFSGDHWTRHPSDWLLDLSWSDPGRVEGEYVLKALRGGWDEPTAGFRSRSRRAVQQAIDLTFEMIADGCGVEELSEAYRRLG
ncbi:hypothetical protein [Nonomuraea cavernae]|uniref:hypothetical protein n=1 Tax=Nonomuraea cavernae TaxID=2045107 RepID=UPI0033E4790F